MIEWANLYLVALVSVFSTIALVAICALGIRFLTNARHWRPSARKGKSRAKRQELVNLVAAVLCFTLCGSALLYGIYLIVPYFH